MSGDNNAGNVQYLSLADFLLIAEVVTGVSAEVLAQNSRTVNLAESALSTPRASFGEFEKYPGLAEKAAILCSRVSRNHPLIDSNKRTAYLCMVEFIERNGAAFEPQPPGNYDDVVAGTIASLASGALPEDEFIAWVSAYVVHVQPKTQER